MMQEKMKKISATDLNKTPGLVLQMSMRSPVVIEKTGRPTAVMLSYEYFEILENALLAQTATQRLESASWLSDQEVEGFLKDAHT
jgi:PHD/YefM family antitoxin component YafN of YafNO toxin-antitoxin module